MRRRDFIAGITGLAAAWPRSARAQQAVIGFMSSRSPEDSVDVVAAFKTAKTLGFEFPPTFSARADEVIE